MRSYEQFAQTLGKAVGRKALKLFSHLSPARFRRVFIALTNAILKINSSRGIVVLRLAIQNVAYHELWACSSLPGFVDGVHHKVNQTIPFASPLYLRGPKHYGGNRTYAIGRNKA